MGIVLYFIMEKYIKLVGIDIFTNNILLLLSILLGTITYFLLSYLLGIEKFYKGKWNQKVGNDLVFSGVQPTGNLHLGNYLGAIKNWVDFQNSKKCIFCIVDLHAITASENRSKLMIFPKKLLQLILLQV